MNRRAFLVLFLGLILAGEAEGRTRRRPRRRKRATRRSPASPPTFAERFLFPTKSDPSGRWWRRPIRTSIPLNPEP